MIDKARKITDEKLKQMEKELHNIYSTAQKELTEEWNAYMRESSKKIARDQQRYSAALRKHDKDEIRKTKKQLDEAKLNQTLRNERYQEMVEETTTRLANVNKIAIAYMNGVMPEIYSINHNAIAPTANSLGIDFTIVNEHAVRNMVKEKKLRLPKRKISVSKDKRWNVKKINSSVLQGIIQGESIPNITKRILPIVDSNRVSAVRAARTMTTEAENHGRFDSYKELQDAGTILTKIWSTAGDDRVRDSHAWIEGEEVEIDKEFSNGLMYPADPSGSSDEVWNCRCSMFTDIKGFRDSKGRIHAL